MRRPCLGGRENNKTHLSIKLDENVSPVPIQPCDPNSEIRLQPLIACTVRRSRHARRNKTGFGLSINLGLLSVQTCLRWPVRCGCYWPGRGGPREVGDGIVGRMRCGGPWWCGLLTERRAERVVHHDERESSVTGARTQINAKCKRKEEAVCCLLRISSKSAREKRAPSSDSVDCPGASTSQKLADLVRWKSEKQNTIYCTMLLQYVAN